MKENQLSRWGALSKFLPLMNPTAKVFLVAKTSLTYRGELDYEFPPDRDGVVRVVSTIAAARDLTQANRGDVVLVLPGHTETLTTTLSLSTAGVKYIGIGDGTLTPTLTVNAAIIGVGLNGANCEFNNFRIDPPGASGDGALAMIKCAAAGLTLKNITGIGSSNVLNFVDCISIKAGCDDMIWDNINLSSGQLAVTNFIHIEGTISRFTAGYVTCIGTVATAGITDDSTAFMFNTNWHNFYIAVRGAAGKPAATIDAASSDGIVRDSFFSGTHTTLASNGSFGAKWRLNQVWLLEETDNTAQGALIPAVDAN